MKTRAVLWDFKKAINEQKSGNKSLELCHVENQLIRTDCAEQKYFKPATTTTATRQSLVPL